MCFVVFFSSFFLFRVSSKIEKIRVGDATMREESRVRASVARVVSIRVYTRARAPLAPSHYYSAVRVTTASTIRDLMERPRLYG